ncbi:hypothetical protein [Clostridium mediterraneense]|nr:hypothetical protein [Clostridium mediterraneense]
MYSNEFKERVAKKKKMHKTIMVVIGILALGGMLSTVIAPLLYY